MRMTKEEELEETICSILDMAEDYHFYRISYKSLRDGIRADLEALLEVEHEHKYQKLRLNHSNNSRTY